MTNEGKNTGAASVSVQHGREQPTDITRHPLIIALVSFALTGVLGASLTFLIGQQSKQIELSRTETLDRKTTIVTLSRFIYDRRVRAEMLASSIKRRAPIEEIKHRKQMYDDSYVRWNVEIKANLFSIRNALGEIDYTFAEQILENSLVNNAFRPLDACVTGAYDKVLAGKSDEAAAQLVHCDSTKLLGIVTGCGYAVTDELYKLVEKSTTRKSAEREIVSRCPF